LKEALNELSSVKLITEILNEEIKFLKQTSDIDSKLAIHCQLQNQETHVV